MNFCSFINLSTVDMSLYLIVIFMRYTMYSITFLLVYYYEVCTKSSCTEFFSADVAML